MTWVSGFLSSIGAKIAIAAAFAAGVLVILAQIFRAGKTSAKLDTMKETLDQKALEAKVRADIDASSNAVRRQQLRDRWSRK